MTQQFQAERATPEAAPTPPRTEYGTDGADGTGRTPYEEYVKAEVLTRLQEPLTDDPAEVAFLVTTQVMELWFTVLVHEWRTAAGALRRDEPAVALAALRRSAHQLRALNASWQPLAQLTPVQFNSYRSALGEGSGFQSAMYRRLEFLLGEKSAAMLVPHRGTPRVHEELRRALAEPSLYDEVLAHLARRGLPVPAEVLERDPSEPYAAHPGVEAVWQRVYAAEGAYAAEGTYAAEGAPAGTADGAPDPLAGAPDLLELGEALTEVAELVWRWRNDHLAATRRAMGGKAGTAGSAGVSWLEKRAARSVFPELWTARSHV